MNKILNFIMNKLSELYFLWLIDKNGLKFLVFDDNQFLLINFIFDNCCYYYAL